MWRKCGEEIACEDSSVRPRYELGMKGLFLFWAIRRQRTSLSCEGAVPCEPVVISLVWVSWVRFNNPQKASAGSISLLQPTVLQPMLGKSCPASAERPFCGRGPLPSLLFSLVCHTATWADVATAHRKGTWVFLCQFLLPFTVDLTPARIYNGRM